MSKKPVLFDTNALNDQQIASETNPLVIEHMDPAWVPGYSEVVKANDLSQSKILSDADKAVYYRRFGSGPKKLKYEFAWLRMVGPSGTVSYRADADRMQWSARGWRPVIVDLADPMKYLSTLGITAVPPAAHVEPDGTIRRLDDALFYVDTEDPRYVAAKLQEAAEKALAAGTVENTVGANSYVPIEAKREESGYLTL